MTEAQKEHAERIAGLFIGHMFEKYEKGAEEHGGNIWDMSTEKLLDEALDEATDQVVYLLTLKDKLSGE